MNKISITWWDVEHGLAIWIKTPSGQSHWIDAGHNSTVDFCPAEYVYDEYGERSIYYLIISHPDADHISGLHRYIKKLGHPKVLMRNKTLNVEETNGTSDCMGAYSNLNATYSSTVSYEESPKNPQLNGGIEIFTCYNDRKDVSNVNDASVVAFYKIYGRVFVFPGDISETGWKLIWEKNSTKIQNIIQGNKIILTAPHHGRTSGYSDEMFKNLSPDLVIISDKYGKEPTDDRFRTKPTGIQIGRENIKFYSTKTSNRIKFEMSDTKPPTWSTGK